MTRAQLRSLLRDYTQESTTIPLTDALANDLLTQGEETLSDVAEYSAAKFTIPFLTNITEYELDKAILSILSVAWNSTNATLETVPGPTSLQRLNEEFATWRTAVAARPERWWILGNAIIVHPKPSVIYNATNIELYCTIIPPAMTLDGDTPTDLPTRFHRTLAKYAAWKWLAIDKENATAQRMSAYWQSEFQSDAMRLRMFVENNRTRTDSLGPRVQFGRDDGHSISLVDPEDRT